MPPRYRKVDKNQPVIVEKLKANGFSVFSTHVVGEDVPDLVVGKDGINMLVEIKNKNRRLRPGQVRFFQNWNGHVILAHTADGVMEEFEKYIIYLQNRK